MRIDLRYSPEDTLDTILTRIRFALALLAEEANSVGGRSQLVINVQRKRNAQKRSKRAN